MNAWYKIALGGSVVLFFAAVIYFGIEQSMPETTSSSDSNTASVTDTPTSSSSDTSASVPSDYGTTDRSTSSGSSSTSNAAVASNTPPRSSGRDLLSQVRSHISSNSENRSTGTETGNGMVDPTSPAIDTSSVEEVEIIEPIETRRIVFDGQSPVEVAEVETPVIERTKPVEVIVPEPVRAAPSEPAAPRTIPPPVRKLPRNYTIQSGDTLSTIAMHEYGSEHAWVDIAQANPMVDPIRLKPGQEIRLPSLDEIKKRRGKDNPPAPGRQTQHIIRSGENLSAIAKKHYNKASLWRYIYNANRERIGSDPDRLKAGMRLTIPPKPASSD